MFAYGSSGPLLRRLIILPATPHVCMLARQPATLLAAKAAGRTTLGVATACHQYNAIDG